MLRAEELMIGDWVRMKEHPEDTFQMEDISGTGMFKRWTSDGEYMIPFAYDEIEPIPLTPEILEKNGFRWTGSGDSTKMLSTPWGFDGIRYNIYVGLKKKTIEVHSAHPELRTESWRKVNKVSLEVCGCFVHELQHALKLCGIEKEIEL